MDTRIDRYLDGELTETEAESFARDLAADPDLEAELRAWERTLAAYAEAWPEGPAAGFEQRVEAAIADAEAVEVPGSGDRTATAEFASPRGTTGVVVRRFALQPRNRSRGRMAPGWLAAAAALVACFGLGLAAGHLLPGAGPASPLAGGPAVTAAGGASLAAHTQAADEPALMPVRLVFASEGRQVRSVSVAGTFNGWDPQATPMQRHDGLWTAVLLLPAGSYEYMFVLDGDDWQTDPLALQKRDDGFGRENAVLDVAL